MPAVPHEANCIHLDKPARGRFDDLSCRRNSQYLSSNVPAPASIVPRMKRTEPSAMPTLAPPGWLLVTLKMPSLTSESEAAQLAEFGGRIFSMFPARTHTAG